MDGHKPVTWEYLTLSAAEATNERLNALGAYGWELVAIAGDGYRFKRRGLSFKEQVTLEQKRRYYALWGLTVRDDAGAGR